MHPRLSSLALILILDVSLYAQEKGLEWPRFRGPEGTGRSTVKLPETWSQKANVVWKAPLPGPGASSPIVVGDRIFVTCYSGFGVAGGKDISKLKRHVVCFDRGGKPRWSKEPPSKHPDEEKNRDDHGYASSTPVCDGERLYVFFGKSGVFAYSLEGEQLWQADVGSGVDGFGTGASPVIHDDLLLVNAAVESNSLVALERKTGKERWRTKKVEQAWNTPLVVTTEDGKKEIVVGMNNRIVGIDPANGNVLWTCATEHYWYIVPSMVAEGGIIYCTGGRKDGTTFAVKSGGRGDVTKTHRLWFLRKASTVPSPILHEGHLYFVQDGLGVFSCIEAKSGKVVYDERYERAGQIYASPILAGDKIYYMNRQGVTTIVPARPEFKVLGTNDLRDGSIFNASPAVAGEQLLLRSDKFLYCIGK